MNTVYLRRGEFRICPRCASRQKGLQQKCDQCGSSLEGARVAERSFAPTPGPHPVRSNNGLRAMLALGVLGAILVGVALRNTFSSAPFDETAVAAEVPSRVAAHAEVVGPDPSVYERTAGPPPTAVPEGWYGLGTRTAAPPLAATSLGASARRCRCPVDISGRQWSR
jgi:hypothetical protein